MHVSCEHKSVADNKITYIAFSKITKENDATSPSLKNRYI